MKNKHILYILLFLNSVIATKAQSGNEASNSEAICANPPAVSLNPTGICSGTSPLLNAIPTNGGITPFYTWKLNNVILPLFTNKTTLDGLGDNNVHKVFRITNNIYAATDIGLSISINSGGTFSNKTKLANGLGNDVVLGLFVSSSKIYAATAAGLSISSDGGNTFINKTTTDGLGSNIVNDVYVDATGNTIYAATASGLSVSTNAGLSFVNKSMSNVRGIFVNGNNIYAATSTGLNISTDGGANFSLKTTANGLGNNNVNNVFKVGSIIYAATSGGLSISTDGSVSFSNKTTANGLGDNNVSSVYAIGSFIYASTVGGLSMSNDGGNTFFINKTATDGLGTNTLNNTFAEGNYIYTATTGGLAIANFNTYQVNNANINDVYSVTMLPSVEVCPSPNPVSTSLTVSSLPALSISSNSPVCSPSTLNLTASGCAGTVTWSQGGATGTSLTLSTVGTYSITAVCSVNGCSSNTSSPVSLEIKAKPTAPTINAPTEKVVCSPSTLNLTASGCAGTVVWSQGAATGTSLTISTVGTYSITANCTVNGCPSPACTAVSGLEIKAKPSAPTINAPTEKVVCTPSTLNITASGCAGTVVWSQGAASGTSLTISTVGTYSITATCTVNGCTSLPSTAVSGLEIKAKPSAPTINAPTEKVVCTPSTLNLTATGCAGTVVWSQGAASGTSLILSTVGTYSITATCTVNGCTSDASMPVAGLEIKQTPIAPSIALTSASVVCLPSSLNLTASGCAGTVTWSNAFTGTSLTISTVGTYSITATCTVNGCPSPSSTAVSGLEIKAKPSAPTINASTEKVVCTPSTLNLTASGCAGTVVWSQGAASGTSLTISAVGTYSITATCTVNGCTSDASTPVSGLEIKQTPTAPSIALTTASVVCSPSTLNLTASGCAGTVVWSQGAASGISLTLSTIGTYSLSATCTVNGCTSDASSEVTGLEIKAKPNMLTINAPTEKVVCFPSTLTLTATACAGTVTWSDGSLGTSLTLSTVGTYSLSATCTVNGCTSDASSAVTGLEIKAKPNAPTINAPTEKVVCFPSTLTLTATACAGTVTWSNGSSGTSLTLSSIGTYSLSATCTVNGCTSDASSAAAGLEIKAKPTAPTINAPTEKVVCFPSTLTLTASGCAVTVTWSNSSSGTSLTLSSVGTYSLSATCTVNGCTSDASSAVTGLEIKAKPNAPTINAPTEKVVCFPSTLTLTANGCAGTVTWSNGSSGTSLTISSVGTYSLSATCTVNGCTSDASSAVTGLEIKAKPNAPTINAPTEKVVCFPSTLTLTATACAGTVTWSDNSIGASLTLSTVGIYSITATCTVNGCTSDASSSVTGLEIKAKPAALIINAPTEKVVCFPSTLTLIATACAGTVTWSDGSSGTSLTLSTVGTYSITATCTVNGCTSDASSAVTGLEIKAKPNVPTINAPTEKVVCFPSTLTLTATACAGTVTWSNGSSGTILILSSVGTYSLSATCTVNGCTSDASTQVSGLEIKAKPAAPTINAPTEKVVCFPSTLTLTATACSGTVTWSNGFSGTSLILTSVGTYSLTATCTVNGCTSDASSAVTGLEIKAKPNAPTINAPTEKVVCFPSTLTLTASGCAGTVTWSNGSSGTSLTLSTIGTYSITATCTVNGCTSDASTAVTGLEIKAKPNAPIINAPTEKVVCFPSTLTLTATACAGTVTWSNGSSGTSLILSTVGTYSLSASCTVNGCTSDASSAATGLEIKAKPAAPTINAPTEKVVCFPSTLTLTATACAGTVTWSDGSSGTSLTLSTIGTYSITATCTVNGCTSDASSSVTGLEIKAKPAALTINAPTEKVVCFPSTLTLIATACAGTVTWSDGSSGTSLTLSAIGTYSLSATCTVNGCTSDASSSVTGLEIKTKPNAPTINAPTEKVVCFPSTLTLTATACSGTVTWSNGFSGTSLTISTIGTYSLSATCTVNGCTSDASSAVTGLEIKTKPNAPTINAPTEKVVCFPSTLTLTATACAGTVTWSDGYSGTSLTLSTVGTYSITATCTVNGCTSDASSSVTGLEIKAKPNALASNTGPYTVGQTIQLNATGGSNYAWTGPNGFTSAIPNPTIANALSANGGIYNLTVSTNGCSATATTIVVVNGIDPCNPSRIIDYLYVKAGNPYQPLFQLSNGMIINQIPDQVSILVTPSLCPAVTIESFEMNIQGPELNWNILQNAAPNALFDNFGNNFNGKNFIPGTYTLTVTGYAQDNKGGGITYGPVITSFTVVGNLATISMPSITGTEFCAGNNVTVNFTTTGTFNVGNQFQVQLSDANGSFANPIIIGTTNIVGAINASIPLNTPEGTNYLIRVASSNQVLLGNPTINLLTINPLTRNLVSPVNDFTGTVTKKASYTINANNKVISPANVTYQAGNSILLTPGFEAGPVFKAEIRGCGN